MPMDTRTRALEYVFPIGMETYWRARTEDGMSIEQARDYVALAMQFDLFTGPRIQAVGIEWANRSREACRQLESWYRLRLFHLATPEQE